MGGSLTIRGRLLDREAGNDSPVLDLSGDKGRVPAQDVGSAVAIVLLGLVFILTQDGQREMSKSRGWGQGRDTRNGTPAIRSPRGDRCGLVCANGQSHGPRASVEIVWLGLTVPG